MAIFASPARADHLGYAGGTGAAGPIIGLSAATLPQGRFAAGARITYVRPEQLSDAELQARAGRHIHAHTSEGLVSPSLSLAYGVTDRFTVALSLPYLQRRDLREGTHQHVGGVAVNGVEALGTSAGLGDATLLAQYRFAGDEDAPLQAAVFAGFKAPSGATHRSDEQGERFETEHQPGTGSWDPLFGLAVTRRLDRVTIDASALYQISRQGAQQTELGDRAQYNLGLAYHVGGEHHHEHAEGHDAEHHHHVHAEAHEEERGMDLLLELNGEWEGRQKIERVTEPESGGYVVYLSPGVRFAPIAGWSTSLSVGLPVAQRIRLSHPENRYRVTAGFARAF